MRLMANKLRDISARELGCCQVGKCCASLEIGLKLSPLAVKLAVLIKRTRAAYDG